MSKNIHPPRAVAWSSTSIVEWQRNVLRASGADPNTIQDEPNKFIRLRELETRLGLSRSTIYRRISEGTFPRPVLLGAGSCHERVT